MNELTSISSIAQVHRIMGMEPPKHPLVTLLEDKTFTKPIPEIDKPIPTELYAICLKNGSECSLYYGRRKYDFQQGSLIFLSPGQSFSVLKNTDQHDQPPFPGWTLLFHPDLIRKTNLMDSICEYSFFNYESDEALHLSDEERLLMNGIVDSVKQEFCKNLDRFSNELIVKNIELLLKHSQRFYSRQFITRSNENKDILIRLEAFLKHYFEDDGKPKPLLSVKTCAREMGYSPNYLSDLLKKETGKNTQEHIYFHILERAKDMLQSGDEPVTNIASALGFEYSQHFSKFFKNKTGVSPTEFREGR